MNLAYIADQNFDNLDYSKNGLPKAEYDNCIFSNCTFEGTYLSGISFLECQFINCNLSNTKLKAARFKDVHFEGCKMMGMPFTECDSFLMAIALKGCILDFADFTSLKLSNTTFRDCSLRQTDFSNCNLSKSFFKKSNLEHAIFTQTNLESTDFRTAINFSFRPENNRLKGAKFSRSNVAGLLAAYQIIID